MGTRQGIATIGDVSGDCAEVNGSVQPDLKSIVRCEYFSRKNAAVITLIPRPVTTPNRQAMVCPVSKFSHLEGEQLGASFRTWNTTAPKLAIRMTKSMGRYPNVDPACISTLQLPLFAAISLKASDLEIARQAYSRIKVCHGTDNPYDPIKISAYDIFMFKRYKVRTHRHLQHERLEGMII